MNTTEPLSRGRRIRRFVIRRLIAYPLLFVGIVAVFMLLERTLVFRPSSASDSWYEPANRSTQDVWLTSADGTRLHAWWIPPERPENGAVLFSHGNGGNVSHRGSFAAELHHALGTGVLVYDYPGYGKSDGKPTEAGCLAAAEAAYRWLTNEAKIPPGRIILLGESLGGGVAAHLASHTEPRALVLYKTFTSLPAAAKDLYPFLPTHTLMRTRLDVESKLPGLHTPVFIAHGTADTLVRPAHAEKNFAAANEPKAINRMPDTGHNDAPTPGFFEALREFLNTKAP